MRKIEYLSPTSIALFEKDQEEFYMTYLADMRAPRFPQTQPMSIGSAFDARVKSFLHEHLFGRGADPKFALTALFEAQVEPHNRDWAWEHGEHAFECYRRSGALGDLMLELQASVGSPRFELEVRGVVNGEREGASRTMGNVVFLGKPDVFYINAAGCHVILDFKVNGWQSRSNVSPMPGYLRIRSGSGVPIVSGPHRNCIPMTYRGTKINCGMFLEQSEITWANQLAIYGWLCGAGVGEDFITAIDQLVCKPTGQKYPEVRVAEHRLRISPDYQRRLFARASEIWEIVHSDHIFRGMTQEQSAEHCRTLDDRAKQFATPKTEEDRIFNAMTRDR